MTALWIGLGLIAALLLVWRLRRAAKLLDRILREERELTARDDATERDENPAGQQNR